MLRRKYSAIILVIGATLLMPWAAAQAADKGSLYVHGTTDAVFIRWNLPTEGSWQGFHVERREAKGEWVRLTAEPVQRLRSVNDIRDWLGMDAEALLTFFDPKQTSISDPDFATVMKDELARSMIELFSIKMPAMAIVLGARYTDTDFSPGRKFDYRVIRVGSGGAESAWAATDKAIAHGEASVLPVPEDLSGEGGENLVLLNWKHKDKLSRSGVQVGYQVYRAEAALGPFYPVSGETVIPSKVEGQLPDSLFADRLVTNGTTYYFYITGVDVLGFESGPSDIIEVTPRDMTPPPPPENLDGRILHGDTQLRWDPVMVEDLAGYRVLRATEPDGPFQPLWPAEGEDAAVTTIYMDTELTEGALFYYLVVSEDTSGNVSRPSAVVQVFREDKTPPAQVQEVSAIAEKDGIHLTWLANTEPDFAGYLVQRTLTITGKGEEAQADDSEFYAMNSTPLLKPGFIDLISTQSQARYAYRVIAIDQAYNMSEPSQTVIARMPDIVPPDPPALYRAESDPDGITVMWQKKVLDDLAGFRVYRTTKDQPEAYQLVSGEQLIAPDATSWVDHPDQVNVIYFYTMTALDETGNESERPSPVKIWFLDTKPPQVPQNLALVSEEDGLLLSWDPIPDVDLGVVSVYRYQQKREDYRIIARLAVGETGQSPIEFLDKNVKDKETYSYFLNATDKVENTSEFSQPVTGKYEKPKAEESKQ